MPPTPECTIARLDLVGSELLQCTADGLDRALHVALDQKGELLLARGILQRLHHLLERARRARRAQRLATLSDAVIGDLARSALRSRRRRSDRRPREPSLKPSTSTGTDGPADSTFSPWSSMRARTRPQAMPATTMSPTLERAALDEHGADRPAPALELGLDDDAFGRAIRIGLEIKNLGLQVDRLEQLVEVGALQRRDRHLERLAAHALDDDLVREQLRPDAVRDPPAACRSC